MTVKPKEDREIDCDSIKLPDVSKHNWKSADIRDRWKTDGIVPGFQPLRETYELATLTDEHPRKAYVIPEPHSVETEEIVRLTNEGLSVKEIKTNEGNVLGIGINDFVTTKLESALKSNSLSELEELFGVPTCCKNFSDGKRQADLHDPVYEIACNTPSSIVHEDDCAIVRVEDPKPILNTFWSYLGWQFIDFHPCSYECENAYDVAVMNGKLMREVDIDGSPDALYEMLCQPASWSGYHGLTHVKNAHGIGSYDCDNRWDERKVIWIEEHDAKADGC